MCSPVQLPPRAGAASEAAPLAFAWPCGAACGVACGAACGAACGVVRANADADAACPPQPPGNLRHDRWPRLVTAIRRRAGHGCANAVCSAPAKTRRQPTHRSIALLSASWPGVASALSAPTGGASAEVALCLVPLRGHATGQRAQFEDHVPQHSHQSTWSILRAYTYFRAGYTPTAAAAPGMRQGPLPGGHTPPPPARARRLARRRQDGGVTAPRARRCAADHAPPGEEVR